MKQKRVKEVVAMCYSYRDYRREEQEARRRQEEESPRRRVEQESRQTREKEPARRERELVRS